MKYRLTKLKFITIIIIICTLFLTSSVNAKSMGLLDCGTGIITNDSNYELFLAKLTRRSGNTTGIYPFVKKNDSTVHTPKGGDDSYFGFTDVTLKVTWPELVEGKCPASCTLKQGINMDVECNGIKEITDDNFYALYENMFYIYTPSDNEKEWYEISINGETGILYSGKSGKRNTISAQGEKSDIEDALKGKGCSAEDKSGWGEFFGTDSYCLLEIADKNGGWTKEATECCQSGTCDEGKCVTGDNITDNATSFAEEFSQETKKNYLDTVWNNIKVKYDSDYSLCEKIIENPKSPISLQEITETLAKLNQNREFSEEVTDGLGQSPTRKNNMGKELQRLYNYVKGSVNALNFATELIQGKITDHEISPFTTSTILSTVRPTLNSQLTVEELDMSDAQILKEIKQYNAVFVECMSIVEENDELVEGFTDTDKNNLADVYDLLGSIGYIPREVSGCDDIISGDFKEKIDEYLNIISIITAILVVVLGVADFGTSLLQSSEDDMKKSQAKLVKRLIIAAIIILTPTLVNFILSVANIIWEFIEPNSCVKF